MAATAPNLQPLPHMTAASHSKIPLSFGNPPRPTTCLPVSGSSSTTEEQKNIMYTTLNVVKGLCSDYEIMYKNLIVCMPLIHAY